MISTHTPLAGRVHFNGSVNADGVEFLLTRPSRGASTNRAVEVEDVVLISTHTPLAGRVRFPQVRFDFLGTFLLTRPSRGASKNSDKNDIINKFLLTRPSRGASTTSATSVSVFLISTHTPLAGRVDISPGWVDIDFEISTHTPLAGRVIIGSDILTLFLGFLLTRPSRGASLTGFPSFIST